MTTFGIWDSGKGDVRKRIACGLGGVEISLGRSTCSLWKPSWRLWNKFSISGDLRIS